MYADRVACCPLVSHGVMVSMPTGQTDRQTADRYITIFAMDASSV